MPVEKQRAPAYPWYPRDFDMDEEVKLMTYEEEGIYRRLLDHQWFHGGLPADIDTIARLVPKIPAVKFRKAWPSMAKKFALVDGRLVNPKLERIRRQKKAYDDDKVAAGKASADARRQKNGTAQPNKTSNTARTDVRTEQRAEHSTAPEPAFAFASASAFGERS